MVDIRPMRDNDRQQVLDVYGLGIATGLATFETEPPAWDEWSRTHMPEGRLVAIDEAGRVVGWAALTAVSERCVYAGVAEVSVYVHPDVGARGIGSRLLSALIEASEAEGLWTLQAGIFTDNDASIRLHERHGFRRVGVRERIGKLGENWKDVLLLERRSATVGG